MATSTTTRSSRFQMQPLEDRIAPCALGSVLSSVTSPLDHGCSGTGTSTTPTPTPTATGGPLVNVAAAINTPTSTGSCGCPGGLLGGQLVNVNANAGTNPLAAVANVNALNDAIKLNATLNHA